MGVLDKLKAGWKVKQAVDASGEAMGTGWDPKKSLAKGVPLVLALFGGMIWEWLAADPDGSLALLFGFFDLPPEVSKAFVALGVLYIGYRRNADKRQGELKAQGAVAMVEIGKPVSEAKTLPGTGGVRS